MSARGDLDVVGCVEVGFAHGEVEDVVSISWVDAGIATFGSCSAAADQLWKQARVAGGRSARAANLAAGAGRVSP